MDQRPNIILIVPHDLGRHLNCYGHPTVSSPNLDRLAAEGVRLANAFCSAPQCSPSRASIATGRYPHSNGVMGLTHATFQWDLHANETHLAQRLKDAGYRTVFGSLLHETHQRPEAVGFEEVLRWPDRCPQAAEAFEPWFDQQGQGGDDRPFFLQMGFFEPHRAEPNFAFGHGPDKSKGVEVPPFIQDDLESRYEFMNYQGAIQAMDAAMGRLMDSLDRNGLTDNTLILFAADHGMPFPRAKCSVYDPGLEVATILRWPKGGISGGRVVEPMISNVDYLPTLLELIGLPSPPEVQGRSFASALRGEAYEPRSEIFGELTYHQYADPQRCIRTDRHKLIVFFTSAPAFMDPSQTWRPRTTTRTPFDPARAQHEVVELYDLEADPYEQTNLARQPEQAEVLSDLLRRLHGWMVETGDPLLEGIPQPPMHQLALASLSSGNPISHVKDLPG